MGRIGLIYNHDRSIECRIQCTVFDNKPVIGLCGKFFFFQLETENSATKRRFKGMSDALIRWFDYHPEVKKYHQLKNKANATD